MAPKAYSHSLVRRAKCRDIVSAILERLLARTQAGTRTLFAKVRAHNSCELNAAADRLTERGATLSLDQGVFAENDRNFGVRDDLRDMLGRAFQDLPPGTIKTSIRLVTWQLPTMAKLVKWGKEQDSTCSCGAPVESAAHVMLRCPTFRKAITAAHDSILSSIRLVLRDQCSHFT